MVAKCSGASAINGRMVCNQNASVTEPLLQSVYQEGTERQEGFREMQKAQMGRRFPAPVYPAATPFTCVRADHNDRPLHGRHCSCLGLFLSLSFFAAFSKVLPLPPTRSTSTDVKAVFSPRQHSNQKQTILHNFSLDIAIETRYNTLGRCP